MRAKFYFAVVFVTMAALFGNVALAERYMKNGVPISDEQYQATVLSAEGIKLLRSNQNQEAIVKFTQAVQLDPNLFEAHHNLGVALVKIGKAEQGASELQKAIAINGSNPMSWLTLAGIYQSTGKVQEAIDAYNQYLKRFPNHAMQTQIKGLVAKLKELPASKSSSDDDYYEEVIRAATLRWPIDDRPLTVFIADGSSVAGYKPEYRDILIGAFDDWIKALGGKARYQLVASDNKADIKVTWTSDTRKLPNPAEAGHTHYIGQKNILTEVNVIIATKPLNPDEQMTDSFMRKGCLHEMGHVLGLTGHSPNPNDVMFYSLNFTDKWAQLSERDIRTIQRLYELAD